MQLFRALGHRPFALLWGGQTVSRLGDSLYQIALAWWVLEKTGSATAMGAVFILSFLPTVLFLFIGGIAADRLPRLRVMFAADIARGVLVAAVATLASLRALEVWHLYAASVMFGFVNAFFQPAYTASVPQLARRELLPSANALTDLSGQLAGVAGPALGAAMISLGDASLAFGLDALSFIVSAACLAPLLGLAARQQPVTRAPGILRSARDGFKLVTNTPWLWITIAVLSLINLTGRSPMNVALPFLVKDHLGGTVGTLGWVYSAFSVGSAMGVAWIGRLPAIRRRGLLVYGGLALVGLITVAVGLAPLVLMTGVAVLALGAVLAVVNLTWTNVLQEHVPSDALGRVGALNAIGSNVLLPVGFGLAGWATDALGAPVVFVIGGAATALLALCGLAQHSIRTLD